MKKKKSCKQITFDMKASVSHMLTSCCWQARASEKVLEEHKTTVKNSREKKKMKGNEKKASNKFYILSIGIKACYKKVSFLNLDEGFP